MVSSFAGGQKLQVTASGLTNDVLLGKSEVRVCKKTCTIDEALSTASDFFCSVPAISTIKSNSEFTLNNEANISGVTIFGGMSSEQASLTTDG